MSWLWKLVGAIVVWVIVALVCVLLGSLLSTVGQQQIDTIGNFLNDHAGVIGFLAGAAYFVWGGANPYPWRPTAR